MMKQVFAVLGLVGLVGFSGCASPSSHSIKKEPIVSDVGAPVGLWVGLLDLGPMKLTLSFDLTEGVDGSLSAKLGCQEQGMSDYPVDAKWQGGLLQCEMKKLGAKYEGSFNGEKMEIQGQFLQGGSKFPLILKRGEKSAAIAPLRPQMPKGPFPYRIEEVQYANPTAEVVLAGTLTLPRADQPSPVVLLIAGSGPNDRDEALFGHKPFLVLADHLTKQGIAVLRVDKRGVGVSTGNYEMATIEDFASDVLAGIDYLKTRNEIDPKKIGLIGHSEGGTVAPLVAAQSTDVAFIALMAGTAVNGEEILYEQGALISRTMGISEEQIQVQLDLQKEFFSVVKSEADFEVADRKLREIAAKQVADLPQEAQQAALDAMEGQTKWCNSKGFRYFLTYDPATALKQVKIPVLALNGERDIQVSPKQNLPVIAKTLEEAGNHDLTLIEFPKLNHLFQTCESGSIGEYGTIEETIAPVVLDTLSGWILKQGA